MQHRGVACHATAIVNAPHNADVPAQQIKREFGVKSGHMQPNLTSKGDAATVRVHSQGPWGRGRVCGCNRAPLNVSLMLVLP